MANSVTSQVMLPPLHMASVEEMPSVSVASFTFCRPLAQAEEHTSQRKTRLAVIRKSWKSVLGSSEAMNGADSAPQQQHRYSREWVRSPSPCRRACSLNTPAEPACCKESRRWQRPRRTPPRRRSLPPGVSPRQYGCKWWRFLPRAGLRLTW